MHKKGGGPEGQKSTTAKQKVDHKMLIFVCTSQTAKVYPVDNSGIRTHALSDCEIQLPEHSALDRSAILPCIGLMLLWVDIVSFGCT